MGNFSNGAGRITRTAKVTDNCDDFNTAELFFGDRIWDEKKKNIYISVAKIQTLVLGAGHISILTSAVCIFI